MVEHSSVVSHKYLYSMSFRSTARVTRIDL